MERLPPPQLLLLKPRFYQATTPWTGTYISTTTSDVVITGTDGNVTTSTIVVINTPESTTHGPGTSTTTSSVVSIGYRWKGYHLPIVVIETPGSTITTLLLDWYSYTSTKFHLLDVVINGTFGWEASPPSTIVVITNTGIIITVPWTGTYTFTTTSSVVSIGTDESKLPPPHCCY